MWYHLSLLSTIAAVAILRAQLLRALNEPAQDVCGDGLRATGNTVIFASRKVLRKHPGFRTYLPTLS